MSEPVVFSDDFYARLGMPHTASRDEIKRAYLQLVKSYPPERAPEEFKRIREAYETLISPSTRQEYDRRPDPAVHECVRRAQEAMTSKDYVRAERHFKEALVKAPELHFVRNMLGLCFLYQGEAEKAVVQYERLLKAGEVEATWLGNAGVAYRMAKRYGDAERAFKEAILRSDDVAVDYYIGLADVFVDQGQHGNALKVLEKGIGADAKIDFNDLRFFMKLLALARGRYGRSTPQHPASEGRRGSAGGTAGVRRVEAGRTWATPYRRQRVRICYSGSRGCQSATAE